MWIRIRIYPHYEKRLESGSALRMRSLIHLFFHKKILLNKQNLKFSKQIFLPCQFFTPWIRIEADADPDPDPHYNEVQYAVPHQCHQC